MLFERCRGRFDCPARLGHSPRHPGLGAAGERRVLGLRDGPRPGDRMAGAGVSTEVAIGRQFRAGHAVCDAQPPYLRPALGSHNIRSLAHGIAAAQHLGLPREAFELQMLYGMADAEKQALVDAGYRLRIYMPYGELIPGMAYLVRRLLENTSNDSFLRASFTEHVAPEVLLMNPLEHSNEMGNGEPSKSRADNLEFANRDPSPIRIKYPAECHDLPPFPKRAAGRFCDGAQSRGDARGAGRSALAVWAVLSAGRQRRKRGNEPRNRFTQSVGYFASRWNCGGRGKEACASRGGGGEASAIRVVDFGRTPASRLFAGSRRSDASPPIRVCRLGSF